MTEIHQNSQPACIQPWGLTSLKLLLLQSNYRGSQKSDPALNPRSTPHPGGCCLPFELLSPRSHTVALSSSLYFFYNSPFMHRNYPPPLFLCLLLSTAGFLVSHFLAHACCSDWHQCTGTCTQQRGKRGWVTAWHLCSQYVSMNQKKSPALILINKSLLWGWVFVWFGFRFFVGRGCSSPCNTHASSHIAIKVLKD